MAYDMNLALALADPALASSTAALLATTRAHWNSPPLVSIDRPRPRAALAPTWLDQDEDGADMPAVPTDPRRWPGRCPRAVGQSFLRTA